MSDHLAKRLTQRLDHMVPDEELTAEANADAAARLEAMSRFLASALPDTSLSPEERLERLARVITDRVPRKENLRPAIEKVEQLERRLEELIPDQNLTAMDRLNKLVEICNDCVPNNNLSIVEKLESLGDSRAGIPPVR